MSNVRDELQRWVEGDSWADQGYESELIPVDLARRVLAEMDAALATLAEIRRYTNEIGNPYRADLLAILDRSTP